MEKRKYDVLAVGDAIVDTLVRAEEGFLEKLGLKKRSVIYMDEKKAEALFGYLDTLKENSAHMLHDIKEMSGGSAANTAAGLSSFGAKVGYIGRVFADAEGKRFFEKLEGRGIDCLVPPAVDGERTGRSLVIVTPDSARTMCTFVGSKTKENDISEEVVKSASVVYLSAFMLESKQGEKALEKLINLSKKHDTKIALSLSDAACVSRHRETLVELVAKEVDILFANVPEISALLSVFEYSRVLKALQELCQKRPLIAVVTIAEKGADIITKDGIVNAPGILVENPVDKTGVGALFASGFLYGYTQNMALNDCGKLGNLAAVEGIKVFGARPASDLSALLQAFPKSD